MCIRDRYMGIYNFTSCTKDQQHKLPKMSGEGEEKKPTQTVTFSMKDNPLVMTKEAYSAIGKMTLSTKTSAPIYGFGTSDRNKEQKRFINAELSMSAHVGKTSPGPDFVGTDKFQYTQAPRTRFGLAERNTLDTGAKYDFYSREDVDFDVNNADLTRRQKAPNTRIGLESRVRSCLGLSDVVVCNRCQEI
eukprot:TRINITY_DN11254_c0_g1_i5.p1 TRINITY_DN11254_c0_g1~~TRINITY_DN11254_c0_g1_i5.p1  ORF type:complete len:190 (+),score=21.05 TRINITY_DN11254_c0_g1_i5:67-636(+)